MSDFRGDFPEYPLKSNTRYELRVNGRLRPEAAAWFEDMTLTVDENPSPPQTIIQGVVRDPAALYGLISRVRDLGLTLLSVQIVDKKEK